MRCVDELPFCTISGCEGLSDNCHLTCPRSVQHRYFIKKLAEIDYALRDSLDPLTLQEVRQVIGNGLGNIVVLNSDQCKKLMIDKKRIIIFRHLEPFIAYDLYDTDSNPYGKVYVEDSYYLDKKWITTLIHIDNIKN